MVGVVSRNAYAFGGVVLSAIGVLVTHSPLGAVVRLPLDVIARERRHREDAAAAAETEQLRRGAVRFAARAAREILIESAIATDLEGQLAQRDAQWANPNAVIDPPPSWSPAAIVARGRAVLSRSAHWNSFADLLRAHSAHLSSLLGAYTLPAEAETLVRVALTAAERAAEGASDAAQARYELLDARPLTQNQRERLEERLESAMHFFFGGLEWMIGRVEELERIAGEDR